MALLSKGLPGNEPGELRSDMTVIGGGWLQRVQLPLLPGARQHEPWTCHARPEITTLDRFRIPGSRAL
jgi:hypothetical protein